MAAVTRWQRDRTCCERRGRPSTLPRDTVLLPSVLEIQSNVIYMDTGYNGGRSVVFRDSADLIIILFKTITRLFCSFLFYLRTSIIVFLFFFLLYCRDLG